jgi:aspartyl-tRNA synthetase
VNPNLPTGEIEVRAAKSVQSAAQELPMPVFGDAEYPEDIRLRYRFLDLRRERLHKNIMLRSNVIASLRRRMIDQGFTEFQTPILTASSPEGARDYLVPSRVHPGKFYALPQAPQMFKQLLMVAGFDRYFQIAPCFRDEDARADRSPGEFYQLDFEMSFVTQDDVFAAIEPVLHGVFEEFANWEEKGRTVSPLPFKRIPYRESMLKYGNDKPDLRNPILITDVSEFSRARASAASPRWSRRRRRSRDPRAQHAREEPQILRRHEQLGAERGLSRASAMRRRRTACSAARSPTITARRA